ncbi:MAG TPA: hypothetical protein DEG17_17825 [Cyanobacteria bacterium UBA11149]|nr:hypothetical protein [Cyanobacteria bacterium UBA11367]HBE59428.1 hypothetical protein [Cyanobacteria bacterium UBA11366]HBK65698.1 hypothetical protein [Cyanobacteria bacterium UBA11166]HBR75211.1 hypothetical protein [Cyanobacteria bacterium UBA11159]HBS68933.1 hypothetical protein [Cyanobacteria bacterium UBA11153]HBW90679.1 hypothetical protein [Cyanobacteria bacterium UBA11149]HCA97180.1 hypothetical protein [Cyanobacteria bacterium UBA9226]
MYDHRTILKQAGIVLIALGILDIAYFCYYISQDQIYSLDWKLAPSRPFTSHGLFIVVLGILLLKGSLRIVPIITWIAAFGISNFSTDLILLPVLSPLTLWTTQFRLNPVEFSLSILVKIIEIALCCWIYAQLRTAPVVSASLRYGNSTSTPKLAFMIGIALPLLLASIMGFTRSSAAGVKAVDLARLQYGDNYQYHLTGMMWSNGNVFAHLIAYNENEIKPVRVEWQQ